MIHPYTPGSRPHRPHPIDGAGRLKDVVATALGMNAATLPDDASSDNTAAWTSLQHLTVIAAVEEEFDITMTMEEMSSSQSLAALLQVIAAHRIGTKG